MEQRKSADTWITPDNNYEGTNPDGTEKHPNKYALLEERRQQIDEAVFEVMKNQKNDVLKRPAVGVVTLIRRELQKKSGIKNFKSVEDEIDFEAEYNTNAILPRLCQYLNCDKKISMAGLKEVIEKHYKK